MASQCGPPEVGLGRTASYDGMFVQCPGHRVVPDVFIDALTLLRGGNVSNRPYCQTYDYLYLYSIFLALKCLITEVMLIILLKVKTPFLSRV
jgi:hypothetical protein